jgi:isoquinoline 1-oxidoreductase subunit beta
MTKQPSAERPQVPAASDPRPGLDRRAFLQVGAAAGGGLLIGFHLLGCGSASPPPPAPHPLEPDQTSGATPKAGEPPPAAAAGNELNAWIAIGRDDIVTLRVHMSEMGQGVLTSFAQVLAEELHADWSKIRSEHALADARYGRQLTGGSSSIRGNYQRLRQAGAAAREMLIAAGAARLGVAAAECRAEHGAIVSRSGKSVRFGEVAAAAAVLAPPESPPLTDARDFQFIGKTVPRLDTPAKSRGEAVFGIDFTVDGMKYAVVRRSPIFGGEVKSFDATRARAIPGVRDVIQIASGVAVVADHTWAAIKGAEALAVQWDDKGNAALTSQSIRERAIHLLASAAVARNDDGAAVKLRAGRPIQAVYEVPYLAHAAMEPLSATARVAGGLCEVWAGTQAQGLCRQRAQKITGLPEDKVVIHTSLLGGGFGRRAQIDFVAEAVELAVKAKVPVKVQWTREDDTTGGYYRPFSYNRLAATLDAHGMPAAWQHEIASPAILTLFGPLPGGIDHSSVEGAAELPYAMPPMRVTYANVELPIPTFFWRSVGSSMNAFVTECFLDELARAGKRDPFELRRTLLAGKPRHRKVLETVAEKAGWARPAAAGRARGIALAESFGTIVAQVAEVSLQDGKPRVHHVTCAVDCGSTVVNPGGVMAQMESGIGFGLSAALYGEITIKGGRAEQDNFDSYPVVRMKTMPTVDVHLVASDGPMGGVGEPGVPPIAPAVCNALHALTGKPIRRLPIRIA